MHIKYAKVQALRIIKRIVRNGSILPTKHFTEMMLARKFDILDVMHVINSGNIYNEAEIHPSSGRFVYTVEGETIDDKSMKVVVDIQEDVNAIKLMMGVFK